MTNFAQRFNKKNQLTLLRVITHIGSLLPLALLIWDYQMNPFTDPIREITLRTGKTTLVLLILSLACTPVNILFGWKQVVLLRKPLGLYAFFYACLHFLTFIWLDYGLNWDLLFNGIADQPYVIVGFLAFVLLIPLAATSTKWAMRKLGKNWKRLHKLVYLIGILGVIHYVYIWAAKSVYAEPLLYGLILFLLLLTRVKPIKQTFIRWRRERKKQQTKSVAA